MVQQRHSACRVEDSTNGSFRTGQSFEEPPGQICSRLSLFSFFPVFDSRRLTHQTATRRWKNADEYALNLRYFVFLLSMPPVTLQPDTALTVQQSSRGIRESDPDSARRQRDRPPVYKVLQPSDFRMRKRDRAASYRVCSSRCPTPRDQEAMPRFPDFP